MAETIETPLSAHEDLHVARDWLEALASGSCDEAAFIKAMPELVRRSPDAGWDLLSMLDQYYRLGKISQPLFNSLKSLLQHELLGPALDIDISVPIPPRAPTVARPGAAAGPGAAPAAAPAAAEAAAPRVPAPVEAAPPARVAVPSAPPAPAPVAVPVVPPAPAATAVPAAAPAPPPAAVAVTAPAPAPAAAPVRAPAPERPAAVEPSNPRAPPREPSPASAKAPAPAPRAPPAVPVPGPKVASPVAPPVPPRVAPPAAPPSPPEPTHSADAAPAPTRVPTSAPARPADRTPKESTPAPSERVRATEPIADPSMRSSPPLRVVALLAAEQARAAQPSVDAIPAPIPSSPVPERSASDTSVPRAPSVGRPRPAGEGAALQVKVGDVLRGRYLLQDIIGRGGMGTVFQAVDQFKLDLPNADRRVAVKVLNPSVCERPELLAGLRREFQNLQALSHPSIVRAYEYDRDGDRAFFTMEFLSGLSVSRVLAARREVPLERAHALSIVRDVGGALAYAHSRGVVHGDLNPGNVFLTDEGEVRVLDFAGARLSPAEPGVATPRYASGQVLEGEAADARDDVYSFACILYLLLTGHHAYGERSALEARTQRARPRRPRGLSAQAWLALRSALAFEREHRPEDLGEWLKAFDFRDAVNHLPPLIALLRVPPVRPRSSASTIALVIFLLALGAGVGSLLSNPALLRGAAEPVVGALADLARQSSDWTRDAKARIARWVKPEPVPPPRVAESAPSPPAFAPPAMAPAPSAPTEASPSAPPASLAEHTPATPLAAPHTPAAPKPHAVAQAPARIEFAASTIDVPPSEPAALVLVRRSGSAHGESSFSWWTESGTARPGEDFTPVAPHVEHFADGESSLRLTIPLAPGASRRQPRSFYVVLSDPGEGAVLGDRSLAMVTLPPPETNAGTR
ncbi:MAG TPA: protein kinase [Steroidobacteraceae bacterium]|nr:protein kinase [Steroidobacteraceae bacterium]